MNLQDATLSELYKELGDITKDYSKLINQQVQGIDQLKININKTKEIHYYINEGNIISSVYFKPFQLKIVENLKELYEEYIKNLRHEIEKRKNQNV